MSQHRFAMTGAAPRNGGLLLVAFLTLTACNAPNEMTGDEGGGASLPPPGNLPCEIADLLYRRCTACHSSALRFSAPMAMQALADLHAPAHSNPARRVFEVIPERIYPQDVAKRMPPTSMPALPDNEKQLLMSWISAGAPGVPNGCIASQGLLPGEEPPAGAGGAGVIPVGVGGGAGIPNVGAGGTWNAGGSWNAGVGGTWNAGGIWNSPGGSSPGGMGGDPVIGAGGAGGDQGTGGGPPVRSGGSSIDPITYDDPEMKCYKFLAHAAGNVDQPYSQSSGEQYMNFTFSAPWGSQVMYSRAIKIVLDPNSHVIHHWLLFKNKGAVANGGVSAGTGIHPDGAVLMHGWAPGASPIYLDPDVGMKLEAGVGYTLEVHFNNPQVAAGLDHSGAEVCVTPKVPAHEVTLSWVGTDSIFGTSATGTCLPANQRDPIHIIAAQPHMHLKGRHMKVVIMRAGGQQDVIHDEDFTFENQRYYVLDQWLQPGDRMMTTCSYNTSASFGPSTNQEMCYFFSLAWPAGALANNAGALLHGANTCM